MVRVYDAQELTLAVTLVLLLGIEHFAGSKNILGLCSHNPKKLKLTQYFFRAKLLFPLIINELRVFLTQ